MIVLTGPSGGGGGGGLGPETWCTRDGPSAPEIACALRAWHSPKPCIPQKGPCFPTLNFCGGQRTAPIRACGRVPDHRDDAVMAHGTWGTTPCSTPKRRSSAGRWGTFWCHLLPSPRRGCPPPAHCYGGALSCQPLPYPTPMPPQLECALAVGFHIRTGGSRMKIKQEMPLVLRVFGLATD